MKAIVLHEIKNIASLKITDIDRRSPAAGTVVVRLYASALNHRDLWIVQGLYANITVPVVLGSDGCGKVVEIGEGVKKDWLEQEVIINPSLNWGNEKWAQQPDFRILGMPDNGTQAEYVTVPEANLFLKPPFLSIEEAAALPLAGLTAYRALFTQGGLQKAQRVLITGIGGGVASLMLNMAVATGSEVWVTSGDDGKIERAGKNGAMGGANYRHLNWAEELQSQLGDKKIDLVVDSTGGNSFNHLVAMLKPGGRMVILGATAGNPASLNLRQIFWKQIRIQGTTMGSPSDFSEMLNFIEKMQIKPVVDSVFPFEQFRSAYERLQQGRQFGKVVLRHIY